MTEEKPQISQEVRLIPWWAMALAFVPLAGFPMLSLMVLFPRQLNPPPLAFQIFVSAMGGSILAALILLVGYVNRDAKRRGMNVALWTILVIFVPNAIGFIIYFLLRQPLMIKCPQCATTVNPSFNYCPKCKYGLRPTCPQCQHAVNPGDKFCAYCAREL